MASHNRSKQNREIAAAADKMSHTVDPTFEHSGNFSCFDSGAVVIFKAD